MSKQDLQNAYKLLYRHQRFLIPNYVDAICKNALEPILPRHHQSREDYFTQYLLTVMKTSVNMFQFDNIMRFKDLAIKSSFSGLPKYHLDK